MVLVFDRSPSSPLARACFAALGGLMLVLGLIGAFLPVMPTTIFVILAAWCFGRSSPRLETWMLEHPRFGFTQRQWRTYGAISRRAKLMACGGMTLGYGAFFLAVNPSLWLAALVALFLFCSAAYVVTRPGMAVP